jgi:hypothetical protein
MGRKKNIPQFPAAHVRGLLLDALEAGCDTSTAIYNKAVELGLIIKSKNIFPHLHFLAEQGCIIKVPGYRPFKWRFISRQGHSNPIRQYSDEVKLLMGYTNILPRGARKVSPLQIYEDAEYETLPNDAIGTGKKQVHIGCSMKEI